MPSLFPPRLALWMIRQCARRGLLVTCIGFSAVLTMAFACNETILWLVANSSLPVEAFEYFEMVRAPALALIFAPASVVALLLPWAFYCQNAPITARTALHAYFVSLNRLTKTTGLTVKAALPILAPGLIMAALFLWFGQNARSTSVYLTLLFCCAAVCGVSIVRSAALVFAPLLGLLLTLDPYVALADARTTLWEFRWGLTVWLLLSAGLFVGAQLISQIYLYPVAGIVSVFLCAAKVVSILLIKMNAAQATPFTEQKPFIITRAYVVDEDKG